MRAVKDLNDLWQRYLSAQQRYAERNQLIMLCNEIYSLSKARKSTYLGAQATKWRKLVLPEYWEPNSWGHNTVDLLTAVLSGNEPQYNITVPGDQVTSLASRAERWLAGVWRVNSRRQQIDLYRHTMFKTILDGGCAVRVIWDPNPTSPDEIDTITHPDDDTEELPIQSYRDEKFPIIMDVIDLSKIYTVGRGKQGQPFTELFHVEMRTPGDIISEWTGVKGAQLAYAQSFTELNREEAFREYVEWWGKNDKDEVWHAIIFDNQWLLPPRKTDYPTIPYILTSFKVFDRNDPLKERLPFLFPLLWTVEKQEYLTSRLLRLTDMYANMVPAHIGNSNVNWQGSWGEMANLKPDERIEFPKWPGNPPDLYRMLEAMEQRMEQSTFSGAMFGQMSSRMSGYALSQLVGADTIRTDTPRGNLEMALSGVAELIFSLLRTFSADVGIAVRGQIRRKIISVALRGADTSGMIIDTFVRAKHVADDVRMASLGAQLASMPNSPVSTYYILQQYFGINQPEDELDRKRAEEAEKDPIIKLMAILEVLQNGGSPYTEIVQKQLDTLLQQQMQGGGGAGGPEAPQGAPQLGAGLPQGLMGNPPMPGPTGNVVEETGPTLGEQAVGGPQGELI